MTGSTEEYIDYVLEMLEPINAISSGKFFGGQGVSCNYETFYSSKIILILSV